MANSQTICFNFQDACDYIRKRANTAGYHAYREGLDIPVADFYEEFAETLSKMALNPDIQDGSSTYRNILYHRICLSEKNVYRKYQCLINGKATYSDAKHEPLSRDWDLKNGSVKTIKRIDYDLLVEDYLNILEVFKKRCPAQARIVSLSLAGMTTNEIYHLVAPQKKYASAVKEISRAKKSFRRYCYQKNLI